MNSRNLSVLTAATQYKAFPPIGHYLAVIPTHDPQSYLFSLLIGLWLYFLSGLPRIYFLPRSLPATQVERVESSPSPGVSPVNPSGQCGSLTAV